MACYGQTCEYLVGAFTPPGQKVNSGHFLMWQAICKMKEPGYRWFDLGGMHPRLTPAGIFHLKAGFRGQPYQCHPELESFVEGWCQRASRWWLQRKQRP